METIDDGDSWFLVTNENRPNAAPPVQYVNRWGHQAVVDEHERLWIIGGNTALRNAAPAYLNEVWIAQKQYLMEN